MRRSTLIVAACLAVAACGTKDQGNAVQTDETLTAENITANDTTAIDAATGEDANMAADVEFTVNHERKRVGVTVAKLPFFDPPRKRA